MFAHFKASSLVILKPWSELNGFAELAVLTVLVEVFCRPFFFNPQSPSECLNQENCSKRKFSMGTGLTHILELFHMEVVRKKGVVTLLRC